MRRLIVGLCLFCAPVFAQDVNCDDAYTQRDMNICAHQEYQQEDAWLNAAWGPAMAQMREFDSYVSDAEKGAADTLLQAQRAWITYRDLACKAEGWRVHGGSLEPLFVSACLAALTKERRLMLQEIVEAN